MMLPLARDYPPVWLRSRQTVFALIRDAIECKRVHTVGLVVCQDGTPGLLAQMGEPSNLSRVLQRLRMPGWLQQIAVMGDKFRRCKRMRVVSL
jgi:hypothetical protein